VEYQQLSVDQIRERLQEVEQSKADLEKALNQRWHEAKSELAQQIREMIDAQGYDPEEIMGMVVPRRRRGGGGKKGGRSYVRYVDPQNPDNVYVRGVLPGWMKAKMAEQGYDSSVKEDREAFKANYLQAVQD
jgi:DNA-binding protein H-NS